MSHTQHGGFVDYYLKVTHAATGFYVELNHFFQAGLISGHAAAVKQINFYLVVHIEAKHVIALVGQACGGNKAYIASA